MSNDLQTVRGGTEEFEPAAEMVISSLETLKVAADPMRLRILEVLAEKSRTVKQVARMLDTIPTKLYYHINLLEEHGLITVTASRIVSGIIEKQYRTSACSIRVSRELLTLSGQASEEGAGTLLNALFDATREDLLRGINRGLINLEDEARERNFLLMRTIARLAPESYREFYDRFKALLSEYNLMPDSHNDTSSINPAYCLTVALFPFAEPEQAEE